ncbi:MAG: type I-E CRISPR-associated protein Cse1/CasA [Burkholderiaceae bacterium]|nr:type I-E CRISPR-associated protein Cse1/CasA [Burkholderiaceae bacterium]
MTLHFNLLEEPLIRTRLVENGQPQSFTLPGLFPALAHDVVRDFPAVRPHQRHPWHAFLVQLAVIALHKAGRSAPFESEDEWKQALLDLTPGDLDGAAWCLVSPIDRPAFMQAPVPNKAQNWKNTLRSADELDMLVTSKNHDLKAARMRQSEPDEWLMALVSLQTQEGFLGSGNYGVSRMNGGFASRPALGVVPRGGWGLRWLRDVLILLEKREQIVATQGLSRNDGIALLWLLPWDGTQSLAFSSLDPFYIEICRLIRLQGTERSLSAVTSGSKAARIESKLRNGVTGDPWIPVETSAAKALTIRAGGFHYRLASELLFGSKFTKPIAQLPNTRDGSTGLVVLAQGVTRGQGKTEGYHERRIPISAKAQRLLMQNKADVLAKMAEYRVNAISQMRSNLRTALAILFDQGAAIKELSDAAKNKASPYCDLFEKREDARFFSSLNDEVESDNQEGERMNWLLSMANNAEEILKQAFHAGPQSGEQRYRARAAALSWFHAGLRSPKTIPDLANYLKQRSTSKELANEHR